MSKIPPKRRRLLVWGGSGVVVVLIISYYAWLTLSVRSELQSAQKQAGVIRSSLTTGDATTASQALDTFARAAENARSHTRSLAWRALGWMPVIGKNTKAVATVSGVAVDVAADAVRPAVDEIRGDVLEQLAPHGGRIDLAAVKALRPTLGHIDHALDSAAGRIDRIGLNGLLGPVRGPLENLQRQLGSARSGMDSARRAADLIPTMLGGSGERRYLLIFDNNAEIRATGGMPGAFAVLTARDGELAMQSQGTATQIPEFARPVLAQSAAEKAIYDRQIATYFQDTNFTPEFPRTADLVRAMWEQRFHGRLDGVISVDAMSLGNILRATGPIQAPGGVTLTSSNAADELLNGVYRRFPSNAGQDNFFRVVAQRVFGKVADGGGSARALLEAFATSIDQGRVYLHSFRPDEQRLLDSTQIAGDVSFTSGVRPQLGVYLNDATGSKMSYYLRTSVTAKPARCDKGQQAIDSYADLHLDNPEPGELNDFITGTGQYGTPKGQEIVLARIYGPVNGELRDFRFDGRPTTADVTVDRGRPVATIAVQLAAGATHRVRWSTITGADQPGDLELTTSPGMTAVPAVRSVPSACR